MQVRQALRAISWVVLTTFTTLIMQPLSAAIQAQRVQQRYAPAPPLVDEKYAKTLDGIEEQVKRAKANLRSAKS